MCTGYLYTGWLIVMNDWFIRIIGGIVCVALIFLLLWLAC